MKKTKEKTKKGFCKKCSKQIENRNLRYFFTHGGFCSVTCWANSVEERLKKLEKEEKNK